MSMYSEQPKNFNSSILLFVMSNVTEYRTFYPKLNETNFPNTKLKPN